MIKTVYFELLDKFTEDDLERYLHDICGLKFLTSQFEGKTFEDVRTQYSISGFALKDFTK